MEILKGTKYGATITLTRHTGGGNPYYEKGVLEKLDEDAKKIWFKLDGEVKIINVSAIFGVR
ncbi:hypothetical protein D3C78_1978870 [compost metagenome]